MFTPILIIFKPSIAYIGMERVERTNTLDTKSFVKNVKMLKESLQGSGKCSNFAADLARGGSKSDGTMPVRLAGKPVKCNKNKCTQL